MLKNFWYAVEEATKITSKPLAMQVLGQRLVAWRGEDGQARVMSDLCVHRGGALSGGWVHKNCIVCPYHGWKFGGDGACKDIPANADNVRIPKKARVDTYPVEERYGWIWVFLGDLPENERPPIPVFPEMEGENDEWRPVYGDFHWDVSYARALENGIDASHTPFVHSSSFGNPDKPQIDDHKVDQTEFSGEATFSFKAPASKGIWKLLGGNKRKKKDVVVTAGFFLPNVSKLFVDLGPFQMLIYTSHIPITETKTRSMFIMLRNFFKMPIFDNDSRNRTLKIFKEDYATVMSQRPELIPFDLSSELHIRSDALPLTYRRKRQKYLKRGWGIDVHKMKDARGRGAVVIPSPARREDPELAKAWVFKEVPSTVPATNCPAK